MFLVCFLLPSLFGLGSCVTCRHHGNGAKINVTGAPTYVKNCAYCTRYTFDIETKFNIFNISETEYWPPGIYYAYKNGQERGVTDTYIKGRFTAPGVTIESCAWDFCTESLKGTETECGYHPEPWTGEANPINTMLCKSDQCFSSTGKEPGRLVIIQTIYEYGRGSRYDCGDLYCPQMVYSDDNAQLKCCTGDRCNIKVESSASNLLWTSLVISVLLVKLFV